MTRTSCGHQVGIQTGAPQYFRPETLVQGPPPGTSSTPPSHLPQYSPARSDARPQSPVPRSRGGFIENITPSPIPALQFPALARTRGYTFDTLALAELVRSSDAHLQNTFSQDPLLCRVEACVVWSMRLITVSLSESAQGNPEPFSGGITFIASRHLPHICSCAVVRLCLVLSANNVYYFNSMFFGNEVISYCLIMLL